jgi:hypothetical protein
VEPHSHDHQVVIVDEVDQAVLVVDATRPRLGDQVVQWLGLANAFEGGPRRVLDQPVEPLEGAAVVRPGDQIKPARTANATACERLRSSSREVISWMALLMVLSE